MLGNAKSDLQIIYPSDNVVKDPLSSAPNPINCELHASLDKTDDSVINEANPVDRAKPLGNLCNNYCMRSETYIEEIASHSNTGTVDISKVTQVKKLRQFNAWLSFLPFIEVASKPLSRKKGDPVRLLSRKQGDCVASHLTSCSKNSIKESQYHFRRRQTNLRSPPRSLEWLDHLKLVRRIMTM